jgi:hypothetical protein
MRAGWCDRDRGRFRMYCLLDVCVPGCVFNAGAPAVGSFLVTIVGTSFTTNPSVAVSGRECRVVVDSQTDTSVSVSLQRAPFCVLRVSREGGPSVVAVVSHLALSACGVLRARAP